MRAENLNAVEYAPSQPPSNPAELQRFLIYELQSISAAINALAAGHLDKSYSLPEKPREGDIRYFEAAVVSALSLAGIYYYTGSAWVFLG